MTHGTYTAEEIAKYLRVHPYTVKRLARQGKIPGFKVGDQWRFDVKEIEEWKRNQGNLRSRKRRK
jgi:excisionase family DNA binding protein